MLGDTLNVRIVGDISTKQVFFIPCEHFSLWGQWGFINMQTQCLMKLGLRSLAVRYSHGRPEQPYSRGTHVCNVTQHANTCKQLELYDAVYWKFFNL